ncbi:MAG: hypothetical protein KGY40_06685 [Thioalkalivibrio sp.]|nr:hypothetical protein [Thioalkalivibrio sp.]
MRRSYVNEGDALFHIAGIASLERAETTLEAIASQWDEEPLEYEDEII